MNKKLEIAWWTFLAVAMIAVVVFAVCSFKGQLEIAGNALVTGGVFAWIALAALGLKALRERNGCFE